MEIRPEEKEIWQPVEGADEFFVSVDHNKPVLCRINRTVAGGFTRYGVVITYPEKFINFPLKDLPLLVNALTRLLKTSDGLRLV